jgi:hypothetical protein
VLRLTIVLLLLLGTTAAAQQTSADVNAKKEDPGDEIGKLKKNCPFHHVTGCLETLFTGQPLHIAVGSIAPQNGFGAGAAYVGHKTLEDWRITWNGDAIGSVNGSWRAGMYWKFVNTKLPDVGIQKGTKGRKTSNPKGLPEQPVINFYVQAISLNKLTFFGIGPDTTRAGRTFYGMRQTILGVSGVKPFPKLRTVAIYGEVNGRFVNIRPSTGQPSPSIGNLYTEATAPGLSDQPAFAQFGEGLRFWPAYKSRLLLNYDIGYRQFVAAGNSNFSFQRLTFDLDHEFRIHRTVSRVIGNAHTNGPNDCSINPGDKHPVCPPVELISNLEGSIHVQAFTSLSMTPNASRVPFYFQPTLGGADINGNPSLSSYQDYRFRAPNILLLRESFEHSIGKLPVGFLLGADQGKVALTRGDLGSNNWLHSYSTGLTLRAGGFPMVYLLFSWGGNEGTHTIANVNTSLLGGSARPSLF